MPRTRPLLALIYWRTNGSEHLLTELRNPLAASIDRLCACLPNLERLAEVIGCGDSKSHKWAAFKQICRSEWGNIGENGRAGCFVVSPKLVDSFPDGTRHILGKGMS